MKKIKNLFARFHSRFHTQKQQNPTQNQSPNYAAIEGTMLVRADHICRRIRDFSNSVKNSKEKTISRKDFDRTMRTIEMIIYQELNNKGKEEWKWK